MRLLLLVGFILWSAPSWAECKVNETNIHIIMKNDEHTKSATLTDDWQGPKFQAFRAFYVAHFPVDPHEFEGTDRAMVFSGGADHRFRFMATAFIVIFSNGCAVLNTTVPVSIITDFRELLKETI